MVDLAAVVAPYVRSGRGNADGIHWDWECHAAVGHAVAEAVRGALSARGTLTP
jgi:hypothetical protein